MKFSIITPVLNREKTIQCTIESVNQQTYKNIQHIIIDGKSSDKTVGFAINKLDTKTSIIISEKDRGIYDAINKGIALSNGNIICILNSDDYYFDENVLAKVAKIFSDNPRVDIVYGDVLYINKYGKSIRKWKAGNFNCKSINQGWITPHCSTFVRSNVAKRIGPYSLKYSIAADYDWLLRLYKEDCIVEYLPDYLLIMRLGGASNKSLIAIIRKSIQDYKILLKHVPFPFYTLFLKNISKINQFFD